MIDPNKIQFQSNPLFKTESTDKPSGLSGGMEVRQSASQPPATTKKKSGFLKFFSNLLAMFKTKKQDIPKGVSNQPLAVRLSHKNPETGRNDKPFDASSLSKHDLLTAGYVTILKTSNQTDQGNVEGFERGSTDGSLVRREIGGDKAIQSLARELIGIAKKQPFVTDVTSFENLCEKEAKRLNKDSGQPLSDLQRQEVADRVREQVETFMTSLFGAPGDPTSTQKAASRFPQSICDLLAIQFQAVEDSAAPQELKAGMKEKIARDTLALRSVNGVVAQMIPKLGQEQGSNATQLTKTIQSLVNGMGLSAKSLPPELDNHNAQMRDVWKNQFIDFANAIVARADPQTVVTHSMRGQSVRDLMT